MERRFADRCDQRRAVDPSLLRGVLPRLERFPELSQMNASWGLGSGADGSGYHRKVTIASILPKERCGSAATRPVLA
jgi:hypothetical protein